MLLLFKPCRKPAQLQQGQVMTQAQQLPMLMQELMQVRAARARDHFRARCDSGMRDAGDHDLPVPEHFSKVQTPGSSYRKISSKP